ncbi:armadillo-type protein [Daldinia caldariorum]|uniref:armadillo-type protein n=1 Tax=Daldinia caldariorum TaxID=326644 RepID=UPI002008C68E|nr:armadillo-type protein [Daldinia caldariorum]KAI1468977.1 armadillo-type protein [Daldinia caldariorum]
MTPNEVQNLFENIPEDEESRVQALKQLLSTAEKLQETKSSELQTLAEQVGNGSREEKWRIPLGRSGLLDFFLSLIKEDELDPDLVAQALRVTGNSCADQNENRQRVVDSGCLTQLVKLLTHDSLLRFAIPVLYNICVDYEPAQAAASKAHLGIYLIDLIHTRPLQEKASPHLNIIYKLLEMAVAQEFEPDLINPQAPYILLSQASLDTSEPGFPDFDGFLGLSSAALAYLSHEKLQGSFLDTPGAVEVFITAFQRAVEGASVFGLDDTDEQVQLAQVQSMYTKTWADLSAHPQFASLCPLDGPVAGLLLGWISSSHSAELQTAACLAFGNIARTDAQSIAFVQELSVHKSLIPIISSDSETDVQLLHCVLSFLKNLSIPASNKAILGSAGLLDSSALPRIWTLDTQPQVQFDAVSLARILLVKCPENVRSVCVTSGTQDKTLIQQLIDLHRKADQEPTKMETARAVACACRVLHSDKPAGSALLSESSLSSASEEEARALLRDFYDKHPTLIDTLLYLGLQSKFPVLRSDLWFVLALMSRSAEGLAIVKQAILQHPELKDLLAAAVAGEREASDKPPAETGLDLSAIGQLEPQQVDPKKAATKMDRENALVLIAELAKSGPDELPSEARDEFVEMLKTGGELVLGDRKETESAADQ